jgi:hypothetical protein
VRGGGSGRASEAVYSSKMLLCLGHIAENAIHVTVFERGARQRPPPAAPWQPWAGGAKERRGGGARAAVSERGGQPRHRDVFGCRRGADAAAEGGQAGAQPRGGRRARHVEGGSGVTGCLCTSCPERGADAVGSRARRAGRGQRSDGGGRAWVWVGVGRAAAAG